MPETHGTETVHISNGAARRGRLVRGCTGPGGLRVSKSRLIG